MMNNPVVAIVGRPNVGKSMLFNRIAGKRIAIVEDQPGTTRDRIYATISHRDRKFILIDTGGLEPAADTPIRKKIAQQVKAAIEEADLIVFIVDGKEGLLPDDTDIAGMLRSSNKTIITAVNKIDSEKQEGEVHQFQKLGTGNPLPVSAYHGIGIEDLLDNIAAGLPACEPVSPDRELLKLAIVGRPNVGKSMLLNCLLEREQVIVDETPGTTRDAIYITTQYNNEKIILIDTAGLKRRGHIKVGVDMFSSLRTVQAIEACDMAALLIDASEGLTAQDQHIAGYISQALKGIICVINKWDLVDIKDIEGWADYIKRNLKFATYAPIIYTSAKTGYGINKILPEAIKIFKERTKIIPEKELSLALRQSLSANPPPARGNRQLKIYRLVQAGNNPPVFEFIVNDSKLCHFSYRRYLDNELRKVFKFSGTPIKISFKNRGVKK